MIVSCSIVERGGDVGRHSRNISRRLAFAVYCLTSCVAYAAADRFGYDPGGRLIQRVDDQGRGTDYVYDPAGNIMQVTAPGQALPPSIISGPLSDQRRNEVRQVSVGGSGLAGVSIRTSHPSVIVTNLVSTATAASFRLAVSKAAPLGTQQLIFQTATGSATLSFNVLPALSFAFLPEPISVAPDNIARKVSLFMSEPLLEASTFGLITLSSTIAKLSVSQISLAPGQTQADLGIIGVAQGTTVLRLGGERFHEPVDSLVFVNPGQGTVLGLSKSVGVSRGMPTYLAPTSMAAASAIGIVRGTSSYASPSAIWNSTAIGIVRGASWHVSATTNPLVAPLVGINRP